MIKKYIKFTTLLFLLTVCSLKPPVDFQKEETNYEWNLISFPTHKISFDSLFGDLAQDSNFLVYRWDASQSRYTDTIDTIYPGLGYFIRFNDTLQFSLDMLNEFDEDSLILELDSGWNMIGNPFAFDIPLPDPNLVYLEFSDTSFTPLSKNFNNLKREELFKIFKGNAVAELKAWTGYFVEAKTDGYKIVFRK